MTSLQSIQSSVRESYKNMSHSRGINDIRGACGAPCVQCEKDEKILSFLDSAVSRAWEAGASAAIKPLDRIASWQNMEIEDTEGGSDPEKGYTADATAEEFNALLEAAKSPTGEGDITS